MSAPGFAGCGLPNQLVQKVELRISCKNLPKADIGSKSDPCAVLYCKTGDKFEEFARTEVIENDFNPDFATPFSVDYHFETVQQVRIRIYDIDNSSDSLKDDDFLGQIETTLGQIVSNSPFTKPLETKKGTVVSSAYIKVAAEEVKEGTETVLMTFKATKLDNKDFLGKSDPFFEMSKAQPDGSWQVVYRSEVVKDDLYPSWRPLHLRVSSLCGGNKTLPIKVCVFDWDSDGGHDLIGYFSTTLEEMTKAVTSEVSWPCINEKKKEKKKSYKDSGHVILNSLKFQKEYSFLDYIFGGTQISMTIGVDFTGSNGDPRSPNSLHHIDAYRPNQYMQAMSSVGAVLQDYDSDKLFPALGFGACLPPDHATVSFEFPLNFNSQNPYCAGIKGVLDAYVACIQVVRLSGPTNVAPIINHVAWFARNAQAEEATKGAGSYLILLLLTDGVLSDMSDVRDALVVASGLPMSLIIVGVGGADFDDMNRLDGDDGVLKSTKGQPVMRDIVQFVPFRNFTASNAGQLASHVLAEIPKQVTGYFRMRGLPPKTPPATAPPTNTTTTTTTT